MRRLFASTQRNKRRQCMREWGGWRKVYNAENFSISFSDSFPLKSWLLFGVTGAEWASSGGWCWRKIYDMCARRVHKTTQTPRDAKKTIFHDCIGRVFLRVDEKEEELRYRCLYSSAHSFDSRFSHAGLASLFITNFRVKNYVVYIL